MNYLDLLKNSYEQAAKFGDVIHSKADYLADYIFDFTTYDSEMSELFVKWAIEVCKAISAGKTFEFIADKEQYKWYLLMVNMPFFAGRLSWGTSIRGAWWDSTDSFDSCGLFVGEEQKCEWEFDTEQWKLFISAIIEFAEGV